MIDWIFIIQNIFFWILIIFLIFIFIVEVIFRIIRKYIYQFPIPGFMTRLIDNPIRRRLIQKPRVVAERLQLKPGMIVVEIGPGKGSYTKAVAKKVLPDGKVYAIDIQESIIKRLKSKIEKEEIPNIIPMIDDTYSLSFEDESVDRIFAIACLPEIPNPIKVLCEFKRILKPDGLISLSELLPDPDYPRRKTEKKWAKEAGLEFREEFGNFLVYQLNFGKKTD